jgi:hypothetical protein
MFKIGDRVEYIGPVGYTTIPVGERGIVVRPVDRDATGEDRRLHVDFDGCIVKWMPEPYLKLVERKDDAVQGR